MFRSPKDYRTFLTILMTYLLDLVGYSIVFPVLAPLLLNQNLHFFPHNALVITRTTMLGFLFATFGVAQFFGGPIAGALADHYGRYKIFLVTIAISVFGYALLAFSIYEQSLFWLFLGRIITGFCSGNFALAQSATADLTDSKHRSKAFGILLGVGGLGFVAGPWVGGILANPDWLFGSSAFVFAAAASLLNLIMVYFFFKETWQRPKTHSTLLTTFKEMGSVFRIKKLRILLTAYLLFSIGWGFFLIFSPTYLVQKFSLGSDQIGNIFAYMALCWFFVSMFLNKELIAYISLPNLVAYGTLIAGIGIALYTFPSHLWPYWIIIPIALLGGALSWVNLGALISMETSEEIQGRSMGASGSMWAVGQIVAPLVAGPLAGWNIYSPLLLGSLCIFICFIYFILTHHKHKIGHPS